MGYSGALRSPQTAARGSDCTSVAAWIGVAILTLVSAGVTFFLTCAGGVLVEMRLGFPNGPLFPVLGLAAVAAVAVAAFIIFVFRRWRRR